MSIMGTLKRARQNIRSTKLSTTRLHKTPQQEQEERVRRATTRIGTERSRAELQTMRMENEIKRANARATLEAARAKLNKAKADQLRASNEKWEARIHRFETILGTVKKHTVGNSTTKRRKATAATPRRRSTTTARRKSTTTTARRRSR